MSIRFMAWIFASWFGVGLVAAVYDATTLSTSALSVVTSMDIWREQQVSLLFFSFTFPAPNLSWFSAIGDLLTWNSSLWGGWGNMIRVGYLLSVTFAVVGSFIISLFGSKLSNT